jgi:hypothetical protein
MRRKLLLLRLKKHNAECINSRKEYSFRRRGGLVQKRQLLLLLNDSGRRFSNEAFEGSREVWLVEITKTANDI